MPNDANIDRRFFESLTDKLEVLGRNIEILNETVMRMSDTGSRGGRGDSLMYNMTSYDYKNDVFRGKELSLTSREASLNERKAYKEYIRQLKEVLDKNIENERDLKDKRDKLLREAPDKRARIDFERVEQTEKLGRKEEEKRRLEALRDTATSPQEFRDYNRSIFELEDEISSLTESIERCQKSFDSIDEEIAETEKRIQDTQKEQRIIKGKMQYDDDTDESKLTYEEYAQQQEAVRRGQAVAGAWKEMRASEKAYYGGDNEEGFRNFKEAKDAQHEFNKRYKEREDLQGMIRNSGVENTAFGKITQKAITRNQRFDNMQNFGRKMVKEGGAERLSKQLFGSSKAAGMAATAFKGVGGMVSKFGKLMGGPVVAGIMMFIDAAKAIGKAVLDGMNEWAKINAEMIKMQTEQERILYEQSKQHLILNTQTEIEKISIAGDLAVKHTEMMSQNFLEGLSIQNDAFVKSMEIGVGAMTMGVAQTAYAAAEANIDQAAKIRKYEIHQGQRQASFELYQAQRQLQGEGKLANIQAEKEVADVQARVGMAEAAFNYRQFLLNETKEGAGDFFSGKGVIAATSALRDETDNTTTGIKGQGNVNGITGEPTTIKGVSELSKDPLMNGSDKYGYGTMVASGIFGNNTEGFFAEMQANFANQKQALLNQVDGIKTKTEQHYNLATTKMEYQTQLQQQVVDVQTQAAEQVIDAATAVEKNWLKTTQTIEEWLRKYDEKMNDVGLNVGMWTKESMSAFKEAHLQTVRAISRKYGKSEEEIAAYQNAYSEASGRNKLLSSEDMDKSAALGVLVGDDTSVAKYVSEMESFNQAAGDSAELIKNEMNNINKLGLNARKYMKDVANNLRLANKYTFKEGTKSLREMVKWAEQTKFNMESLGGMIDKVREGGIEGVITQSAGFQVLGGMAAINSDPLGMLFDAWADAPAYAKRLQDMTKGFGTFDRKTGETLFNNIAENMQIEQIAKLQGRSGEELRQEIRRRNQMEAVRASMTAQQKREFTDEQIQFLSNSATYDQENQQWKFNLLNKETGQFENKTLSELSGNSLSNYASLSDNYEDRMTTMVEELVSLVARERGEQMYEMADQAAMDYKKTMDELNARLVKIHDDYDRNRKSIHEEFLTKQQEITDSVKSFLEQFATNMDDETSLIATETKNIREKTENITSALQFVSDSILSAQSAINTTYEEKLANFEAVANKAVEDARARINGETAAGQQNRYSSAFNALYGAVSEKELNDRIDAYKTIKEKTKKNLNEVTTEQANQSGGYREVLDLGTGNKEILNVLKKANIISSDKTSELTVTDLNELYGAMEYFVAHGPDEYKAYHEEKERQRQRQMNAVGEATYEVVTNKDAYFPSNGRPTYVAAENAVSINDGLVKLNKDDSMLAYRPNDTVDNFLGGLGSTIVSVYENVKDLIEPMASSGQQNVSTYGSSGSETVNHVFSGTIRIESNGQSADFLEMIKSNPMLMREFTASVVKEMRGTRDGGRISSFDSGRNYVVV